MFCSHKLVSCHSGTNSIGNTVPAYCRKAPALESRALHSAPFSDTTILTILEKSLYFSEFSGHPDYASRLKSPWSCMEGTISQENSWMTRPVLPTLQQIHQTQGFGLGFFFFFPDKGAPNMSAFFLGQRPVTTCYNI